MFRHASLNRIYRLVWNEARRSFVAVAETTRARGKCSGVVRSLAIIGVLFNGSYVCAATPTSVVPTGGNTKAYIAPNGVPVVDINTANGAGVSHNQYLKYNVDPKGLVLNNGNSSQIARQSQLAGQVMANANLAGQANLILNEVVTPNRSQLAGFTEVLGGKADVVVANPYGITCSGCGFINTDRATLTTGTPVLGASGALSGFNVTRGDILINGNGLNGSAQQILDLVARSIKIDGQVNAGDLSLTAGANQWDYASRSVTAALTAADSAPAYSIDSTVFGGMYANRIKIVATEAGVGVRMAGDAAASVGDFALDSSGKIIVRSKLSAARDLHIATTAGGADALALNDATIAAKNNADLAAKNGGISLRGGVLVANNDFAMSAETLSDSATATALTDNNKRFAAGAYRILIGGAGAVDGVDYGSGAAFDAAFGNLSVGAAGARLYSGGDFELSAANDLALANAVLQAAGSMHLSAANGALTTTNGAGQGIKVGGDIVVDANEWINAGTIDAAGNGEFNIGSEVNNSGTIYGAGDVIVRGLGASAYRIDNSGRIEAGALMDINDDGSNAVDIALAAAGMLRAARMQVKADTLTIDGDNSAGGIVNSTGAMNLDLHTLSLAGARSRIVAASGDATANAGIKTATQFINYGAVYSGGNLTIESPSLQNAVDAGIAAAGTLQFIIDSGNLQNEGALYAGAHFIAGSAGQRVATFTNTSTGTVDSNGTVAVYAASFVNNHAITATGDITISAAQFHNDYAGNLTRQWSAESVGNPVEYYSNVYQTSGCFLPLCLVEDTYYYRERVRSESFIGNPDLSGDKPQILSVGAGAVIAIQDFDGGSNKGGIISASNVALNGNVGSQFVNDSLALHTETTTDRWYHQVDHTIFGDDDYGDHSLGSTVNTVTHQSAGAGIYAGTGHLSVTNAALTNNGDVLANSSVANMNSGAPRSGSVTGQSESGASAFPGLSTALPSNPNGLFVPAKNSNSQYLVESNPLYALGSSFVGSNYLLERFGYDPNVIEKRLGDANYEGYLLRQQLIAQIGTNVIKGYASEAAQMRGMMDSAVAEGKRLGLSFGTAPTVEQLAGLKEDIVWMVETEVAGQKVLAPAVYLAPATRASYQSGAAIIAGSTVSMNVASLSNVGGVIASDAQLDVTSKADITNISGAIKGGDVSLQSTEGSIVNRTYSATHGDDTAMNTEVGKQASIESSGNLTVDAAKDVTNLGAKMAAGKDAGISAGGDVTFDTVEKKTATTTRNVTGGLTSTTITTGTTKTTEQIKSELSSGGNLQITSKKDVTLAGTDVKAGGDAAVGAAGDVNIIARSNTAAATTSSSTTGLGVGGGLFGKEKTDTDEEHQRNVGSSLDIGGNAKIEAGKDVTLQGSKADVKGDVDIDATNVNVLAGQDTDSSTTTKTTTTFLKADSQNKADAGAAASATAKNVKAGASASASAEASSDNTLTLMSKETSTTESLEIKNKGSAISAGGAMSIDAKNKLTAEGSSLESGGDMDLKAKEMEFKAAEDVKTTTTTSETTSVALYNENKASAKAEANAAASIGTSPVSAGAEAGAQASTEAGIKVQNVQSTKTEGSTTAVTSSIKSGGDMTRTATGKITDVGTQIEAGGDFAQSAREIDSKAAKNTTYSSSSSTTNTGKIGAYAEAGAKASGGSGDTPKAEANASAGGHIGYENKQESATSNSSEAVVSTIKAGGNISSTSKEKTSLEGTRLASGKDTSLEAGSLDYKAAQNSASSTSSSSTVKADIKGGANYGTEGAAKAEIGGGYATQKSSESSTTAVVGGIDAGGKLSIKTRDDTRLEGTQLQSGGDTSIDAGGNVKVDAARNTQSKSSEGYDVSGSVSLSKKKEGEKEAGIKAEGGYNKSSSDASQAVTSDIAAGGKVNISAGKSATLEGTTIRSGGDTNISAKDNVALSAAHDTSSSESLNVHGSLSASASTGKSKPNDKGKAESAIPAKGDSVDKEKSAAADAEKSENVAAAKNGQKGEGTKSTQKGALNASAAYSKEKSSTAEVGSISSGGSVNIAAGKETTLEGTRVDAKGATNIEGAKVNINAAESSSESLSIGGALGVKANTTKETDAKGKETKDETIGRGGVGVSLGGDRTTTSTEVSIKSGDTPSAPATPETRPPITLTNNTFKASVSIPANLPAGKKVEATTADGKPLPAWLSFDAKTGAFVGTPPADFRGELNVVVKVPNESGGVSEIPLRFQKD